MDTTPKPVAFASDADLPEGYQVGEYIVDDKIGEGGFGTVFRATHPLIGKQAAIKVLSRRYSVDPEMLSRFVSEARAVNQIRHRNIIDIFAFGQLEDGRSYFVMELLDGEPLDRYLDNNGAAPLAEAVAILRPIARALDAAHAKGIAHRDLKPENIFLSRDADGGVFPKLLDFGIAKLLGEAGVRTKHKTRTGAPIGTPSYMSPEQCRGESVDHRTDIYTFGCVAYQLITGGTPFDGANDMAIMLKHCSHDPEPASRRVAGDPRLPPLPREVDDILAWLMRKEPSDRPKNLATAMDALERAAGIEPVSEGGVSLRTPTALRRIDVSNHKHALAPTMASETPTAPGAAPIVTPVVTPRSRGPFIAIGLLALAIAGAAVWWFELRTPAAPPPTPEVAAPTPAPAPAPPTPEPAPPPATTDLVSIQIAGVPDGTRVSGPDGEIGTAPGEIKVPRSNEPLELVFDLEGYTTKTREVTPNRDLLLEILLDKMPAVGEKSAGPKSKRPPKVKPKSAPGAQGSDDPYSRK